jgi:polar amino acid transport system substrate-binding protein/glutamate/aspartate transport system substrate-binding protein
MTNNESLVDMRSFAGHKIGVLAGATTEKVVRWLMDGLGVATEIVPAKTHVEGLEMLEGGITSAYFADHAILRFLVKSYAKHPDQLHVSSQYLTVEPYALALPPGDDQLRLAVDTALSHIFRSDEIDKLYSRHFGVQFKQNHLMRALYLISGLPD